MNTQAQDDMLHRIYDAMAAVDTEATPALVAEALGSGHAANTIIDALSRGLHTVGDKFEAMDYFLPDLIRAANTMDKCMEVLRPELAKQGASPEVGGTIVLAQLQGDIHDIGRNIVSAVLRADGFTVHDLGHDVKPDMLIDKAVDFNADVIGLSALLTTSLPFSKQVLQLLAARGLRGRFKVAMGGGAVTPAYSEQVGADGYARDAASAVRLMKQLIERR